MRRVALVGIALVAIGGSLVPSGASAQSSAGRVVVVVQHLVGDEVEVELRRDGVAVGCQPGDGYAQYPNSLDCPDLAPGEYVPVITGQPDATFASAWECTDQGLLTTEPTAVVTSGDFIVCMAQVFPPSVSATVQQLYEFDISVGVEWQASDGEVLALECRDVSVPDSPSRCVVPGFGTYSPVLVGAPTDYSTRSDCGTTPRFEISGQPAAAVTAERPTWACSLSYWPSLEVLVDGDDALRIEDVAVQLTDASGADVSSACTHTPTSRVARCAGLPDGTYGIEVAVDGEPKQLTCLVVTDPTIPAYDYDTSGFFTLDAAVRSNRISPADVRCYVQLFVPTDPGSVGTDAPYVPDETEPTIQPPPLGQLPDTGTTSWWLVAAAATSLLGGIALVVAVRRRPAR